MFEIIKSQMAKSVPFVATTGVRIVEVGPGTATAALEQRTEVSNHIGSLHAGALFTLGETASGAAMSGGFASQLMSIRPVATSASIAYVKVAKGEVTAHAVIKTPIDALLTALAADGRITFDVDVTLTDANSATVATMTVGWLVAKR